MADPTEPAATGAEPDGTPEGTEPATQPGQPGQSSGDTASVDAGAPATPEGTGSQPEETFFDPKEVPPDLQPAYKQMQNAFREKTERIARQRQKVEAYDAFTANPVANMQQLAQQYGYQLIPATQPSGQQADELSEFNPQNWKEVFEKAADIAYQRLQREQQQRLEPVIGELQSMRKSQLEKTLDDEVPEWRQYEEEMTQALQDHPTLVKDPAKLARIAIPEHVWQSKAMQAAMKRLQQKSASAQTSGGSTTRRQPPDKPSGPLTFDQAVEHAKKQIAAGKGIAGGRA